MRIRVVDLETTGFEATCRVVEIGTYDVVQTGLEWSLREAMGSTLVNPGVPIPPAASSAHHIIDEDVLNSSPWHVVHPSFLHDTAEVGGFVNIYAAHNAGFERQFITDELSHGKPWICTWKCALRAWPEAPGHSNGELRYWLRQQPATKPLYDLLQRELSEPAHRALPDSYVTAFLLLAMLPRFSVEDMVRISSEPAILPRLTFGKHRGKRYDEVPRDYLRWIVQQSDMDENVKHTARTVYNSSLESRSRDQYGDER